MLWWRTTNRNEMLRKVKKPSHLKDSSFEQRSDLSSSESKDNEEESSLEKKIVCSSPGKKRTDDPTLDRKVLLPSSALSIIDESNGAADKAQENSGLSSTTDKEAANKALSLDEGSPSTSKQTKRERSGGNMRKSSMSPKRKSAAAGSSSPAKSHSPRRKFSGRMSSADSPSRKGGSTRSPKLRRKYRQEDVDVFGSGTTGDDEESLTAIITPDSTAIVITLPSSSSPSPTNTLKGLKATASQKTDSNSLVVASQSSHIKPHTEDGTETKVTEQDKGNGSKADTSERKYNRFSIQETFLYCPSWNRRSVLLPAPTPTKVQFENCPV